MSILLPYRQKLGSSFIGVLLLCFLCPVINNAHATEVEKAFTVCAVPQLYDSLTAIKASYIKEHNVDDKAINLEFKPASNMYTQIQNAEVKCDVYLGNDIRYPALLIKSEAAVADSLHAFARAQLVLWSITSIVDNSCSVLTKGVYQKLSLPNPKTQASGYAALTVLEKYGLKTEKIRSKLMYGANEYQTLSFIINGNVIMGILPLNLLHGSSFAKTGSYCVIPENYYEPLYYYSVTLNNAQKEKAMKFTTYLFSENSKKILKEHGFR